MTPPPAGPLQCPQHLQQGPPGLGASCPLEAQGVSAPCGGSLFASRTSVVGEVIHPGTNPRCVPMPALPRLPPPQAPVQQRLQAKTRALVQGVAGLERAPGLLGCFPQTPRNFSRDCLAKSPRGAQNLLRLQHLLPRTPSRPPAKKNTMQNNFCRKALVLAKLWFLITWMRRKQPPDQLSSPRALSRTCERPLAAETPGAPSSRPLPAASGRRRFPP